jgi:hypothetical protein
MRLPVTAEDMLQKIGALTMEVELLRRELDRLIAEQDPPPPDDR